MVRRFVLRNFLIQGRIAVKWTIRHIIDGMYTVSPRFSVYSRKFARRFSSRKQAEAYIISSGFDKTEYIAEEFHDETESLTYSNTQNVKE